MTSNEQRAALQRKIWDIANDVRGAVDGWDFKQYVLGTLFYRFISENFIDYITGGDLKQVEPLASSDALSAEPWVAAIDVAWRGRYLVPMEGQRLPLRARHQRAVC